MPQDLVNDGYQVVNASWVPLYIVGQNKRPAEEIFAWNYFQFKPFAAKAQDAGTVLPASKSVIGAMMCTWEQAQELELPSLRERVPAMAERIWNPDTGSDFTAYVARFKSTDAIVENLVNGGNGK